MRRLAAIAVALAAAQAHAGERGKIDVAANPFGVFFSYYDAGVSYEVTDQVAVSVSAASYSRDPQYDTHDGIDAKQVTASAPLYLWHTFSGPFAEPGIVYRSGSRISDSPCRTVSGPSRWVGIELLVGWHWSFDSGLDFALAFGIAKHVARWGSYTSDGLTFDTGLKGSFTEPDVNGYFRVGYTF